VLAREHPDRLGPGRERDQGRGRRAVPGVRAAPRVVAPAPAGRAQEGRDRGLDVGGRLVPVVDRAHAGFSGAGTPRPSTPALGLVPSTQRSAAWARTGGAISPRPSMSAMPPFARGAPSGAESPSR